MHHIDATNFAVRCVPATQFPAEQQSQLAVNLKVLQPAMSSGEGETVEGTTINPAKLPICGGVPLCEKEEVRALH